MEQNLNDVNEFSTQSDDASSSGPTEQELLDAVMKNSPIMEEIGVPLPEEETEQVDPAETSEEVDPVEEEVVSEETEEEVETEEEKTEEDDAAEEAATNESEVLSADEIDLDAKVTVKIDGEDLDVSFGDLIKGYSTEQSLSKKGRELGEARKALDAERDEKLKELSDVSQAAAGMLMQGEQTFAKEYHELEQKIEKARKENDTFELGELKDKREQVQAKYWNARKQREGMIEQVQKFQQEQADKAWQDQLDHFHKEIPNLIPDFNDTVAKDIREFAMNDLGLTAETLNGIADPKIVWALNDYRQLKKNVAKGTAKRKVVPTKKAIPTKKSPPAQKKAEDKAAMVKARAFKENASADDQMAFLRQHASNTLNTIK